MYMPTRTEELQPSYEPADSQLLLTDPTRVVPVEIPFDNYFRKPKFNYRKPGDEIFRTGILYYIIPGDSITGLKRLDDINLVVNLLAAQISPHYQPGYGDIFLEGSQFFRHHPKEKDDQGNIRFLGHGTARSKVGGPHLLSDTIRDQLDKISTQGRKFNGDLKDFKVIIAPSQTPDTEDESKSLKQILFYFEAGLFSTGRGHVGVVRRLTRLSRDEENTILLSSKALNSEEVRTALERLQTTSHESYQAAYQDALRHVYHAGLPGLGKR